MNARKLRIAILSVHSSPLGQPGVGDTGGMSIYIRELSREMAKMGHAIDIFTRAQDPDSPEIIELTPGARLIHIPAGEPADIDKLLVYSTLPDFACAVANFGKRHSLSYDVIFSHYWLSGVAGKVLQSWWKAPQVMMFHTLGAVKNAIGIGEDEPELRLKTEEDLARSCQLVIASTINEKQLLHKYYDVPPGRISVVPCGVNLSMFQPLPKVEARRGLGLNGGKIILFVGRIERLKGIDKLIEAMPHLKDIGPELLIVGEDGNRPGETDNLKNLAAKLGVGGSVKFPGLIDHEKLPDFYSAADVCVLPSYYESFGLAPLESLACGTPVVATDVGNLRNVIRQGETGYVLKDNQPKRLAARIGAVLADGHELGKTRSIRASVKRFDWKFVAEAIVKDLLDITAKE